MKTFIKTATVTSAALALLAGSVATAAQAEEAPAAATTSAAAAGQGALNAWYQPGEHVKTGNGLFVVYAMGIVAGPDGTPNGAGAVENYDLSKIYLELVERNGAQGIKANIRDAVSLDAEIVNSDYTGAIGAWSSSDESVISVNPSGNFTVGANGAATVYFTPAFIQDETVVYSDGVYAIDLQVTDGKVALAPASALGLPLKLADGIILATAADAHRQTDGTPVNLASVPVSAFDGADVVVDNAHALTVGDTLNAYIEYTHAAGRADIEAIFSGNEEAGFMGKWVSSNPEVVSVNEEGTVLTAVGEGTATITYVPDYVAGEIIAESPVTFSTGVTVTAASQQPAEEQPAAEQPASEQPAAQNPAAGESVPVANNEAAVSSAQNAAAGSSNGQPQELANTGAEGVAPLVAGLGLLAAGGSALVVSRRRAQ
ncbi:MAG: Ig-like domain-containing protein [Rothia sp. (in: high G+C Gram-positive bacteria)]|nr:Ig-like domain-containing protein [Rothia sp. (in: high G+C Gram-positive bacteria)]